MDSPTQLQTRCCIAGGGPAGMMLGYLLARAGVEVIVLEKHADFLRDFRGDTIHPSTLEVMHELGILEDFLKRPHQEVREIAGQIGDQMIPLADFTHLPTQCKFLAFMPQWDFLDFIKEQAVRYSGFTLKVQAEVTGLIEAGNTVVGVRAPGQVLGRFVGGKIMVMLNRDTYWQCGYVIPKGDFEEIKRRGLEAFRADITSTAPFLSDRVRDLPDWEPIKLLTVMVDRLRQWYRPGLLCIGDAAHAMSPVGGVGINLAIQDAVAAANILARPLSEGWISPSHLQKVQWRRELPTRLTQWAQVFVQNRVIGRVLGSNQPVAAPWPIRLFKKYPVMRRIPARLIGIGVRPEHVRTVVQVGNLRT